MGALAVCITTPRKNLCGLRRWRRMYLADGDRTTSLFHTNPPFRPRRIGELSNDGIFGSPLFRWVARFYIDLPRHGNNIENTCLQYHADCRWRLSTRITVGMVRQESRRDSETLFRNCRRCSIAIPDR